MNKLVILNIDQEDFQKKFSVNLQILTDSNLRLESGTYGKLPSKTEDFDIFEDYNNWKKYCFPRPMIGCDNYAQKLKDNLHELLNTTEFQPIQKAMRSQLNTNDEIRIIIQTEDPRLQRLPWNIWSFFDDYPNSEVALGLRTYKPVAPSLTFRNDIRILSILGNQEGINLNRDRESLNNLSAKIEWLAQETRSKIDEHLYDEAGWDLLYFAGHSETEGSTGKMYINDTEHLTIEDIKLALKHSINKGLQIAIFNSCDGLGLARELARLNIPQIILMREPIFDKVAHTFLVHFVEEYHSGKSLYLSVRKARVKLKELENEFLYSSWLPVIFQNVSEIPLTWQDILKRNQYPDHQIYVERPPCEEIFYNEITQIGALVRVKAPQKFGKTQLVNRIINQVKANFLYSYTFVNFGAWPLSSFTNEDRFFKKLFREINKKLKLNLDVNNIWQSFDIDIDSSEKFSDCIQDHLLKNIDKPHILILEQFEIIFQECEFYSNICNLLRSFSEESSRDKDFEKLRLVIIQSTDIDGKLDRYTSPFTNVEKLIELPDFESSQIEDLIRFKHLNWRDDHIQNFTQLLGGHPYLVCQGIKKIAEMEITLEHFFEIAHTESSPYINHLRKYLKIIKNNSYLEREFMKIINASESITIGEKNNILVRKLYGMGLIRIQKDYASVRCDLYRKYFSKRLSL